VSWVLEFYEDGDGRKPVLIWITDELDRRARRSLGTAMRQILQEQGVGVCGTAFGRQLGQGLFEFRLRESNLLLRVFCHAHGDRVVLLLGGYNKAADPSKRRQEAEIAQARNRLRAWRETQRDSRQYGLKTISSSHEKQ
jgi:putative component of toxin-antitoxin plasmid stabilization module